MEPLLEEMFDLKFEIEDVFYKIVNFTGTNVTCIHINTDFVNGELFESVRIYDIYGDGVTALPMFTTITLEYDKKDGMVNPYYNTVYGILKVEYTNQQRIDVLTGIIQEGIEHYNENRPEFISN